MEQSRRRLAVAALTLAVLGALVAGGIALARPEREQETVKGHLFPIPSTDERVTVEVLNAAGRQGLARTVTRVLRQQGLDVVFLGNAGTTVDSTRIVARRGDAAAAQRVRDALGHGRVVVETDTLRRVDVSVIVGPDYRPELPLHP